MGLYDTEQGPEHGDPDATRLDTDLKPWLKRECDADAFLTEFPYHTYAGQDHPISEDEKLQEQLDSNADWAPDSIAEIRERYGSIDHYFQRGPYRTDLVAVHVDRRALRTRIRRVGQHTPLNQNGSGKRRNRRTYLTFTGDGPMTREYWETDHGGDGELRSYGESSASRAFGWLKKRGFLAPTGDGAYDAVSLPLHVYGGVHAVELKVAGGEWDTALEQAARADVYADYRWVAMDAGVADRALANTERFADRGVGLLTVHPEDGVTPHVWPTQCTPTVDRDVLDRYMVERWDCNERVLKRLEARYDSERDPEKDPERFAPGVTNVLGEIQPESVETASDPPLVHGGHANTAGVAPRNAKGLDTEHKALTSFSDE